MTFLKIGAISYLCYLIAVEGLGMMLGQAASGEIPVSLWYEVVQKGGTIVVLAVGLWFSWKHHMYTLKYYRARLESKEKEKAEAIAEKDAEIKRLNAVIVELKLKP